MNIKGTIGIVEIKKKGAYAVTMEAGNVTVDMTAFFSNKVPEKDIKKIEEGDLLEIEGFTSTRKSDYNGYENYDTVLIITKAKIK